MNRVPIVTLVATALVACSGAPTGGSGPEIRIGVLALRGAPYEEISGQPTLDGASMAADEINAEGGVLIGGVRHLVRLVPARHSNHADDAVLMARRLVNLDSVHVLVGPQASRHAIPVARLASDARITMASPMSSNPETTAEKPYVFRIAARDDALSRVLARFATGELGARKAASITDRTDPYSRNMSHCFSRAIEDGGGTVLGVSLAGTDADKARIDDILLTLHQAGPDVVFAPVEMKLVARLLKRTEALGLSFTFLGSDSWDIVAATALPAAEGSFIAHQYHPDLPGEAPRRFVDRHVRLLGHLPRATTAMTYDAVHLLTAAIGHAGSLDGQAIRDALAAAAPYDGATGRIVFRGTGDPERSVALTGIRGGEHSLRQVKESE